MDSIFVKAKKLFVDTLENDYFVLLTRTRLAYSKLANSLKNPFKIILLYGRPGTGKSFLLQRFYADHKEKFNMFLYLSPTFDSIERLKEIYEELFGEKLETSDQHKITKAFKTKTKDPIFVLLDEAQLYSDESLEWIRILSNEEIFRFIIVVHKVDSEDLLAKEHFKTRTFETIELSPVDLSEISRFLETKLLLGELGELYDRFDKSNYEKIYQLTKGNLRDINRLLHKLFELLEEINIKKPHKMPKKFTNRLIEMSAMELGILNG